MNPLPAHTTHAVPLPANSMHSIDFVEFDDHIRILSWDDSEAEPIVSDGICEMSRVTLGPRMLVHFRLVLKAALVQTTTVEPLTFPHYNVQLSRITVFRRLLFFASRCR